MKKFLAMSAALAALFVAPALAHPGDFSGANVFVGGGERNATLNEYGALYNASGPVAQFGGQYLAEVFDNVYVGFDAALDVPLSGNGTKTSFVFCTPTDYYSCTGVGTERNSVKLRTGIEGDLIAGYGFRVFKIPTLVYGKFGTGVFSVSHRTSYDYGGVYPSNAWAGSVSAFPISWSAGLAVKLLDDWTASVEYTRSVAGLSGYVGTGYAGHESVRSDGFMARIAYSI